MKIPDTEIRLRDRKVGEITPVEAEHSRPFKNNEEKYAAKFAIDLDMDTSSKSSPLPDGACWIRIKLDQVRCVEKVITAYWKAEEFVTRWTWTCTEVDCSSCKGQYCHGIKVTVYSEGATPENLPSFSDCKYGDTVNIQCTKHLEIPEIRIFEKEGINAYIVIVILIAIEYKRGRLFLFFNMTK